MQARRRKHNEADTPSISSPARQQQQQARRSVAKLGIVTKLFAVLFAALVLIELLAYRLVNEKSSSSRSIPNSDKPSRRPTASNGGSSIAPTTAARGFRVKAARRSSNENSAFWQSHVPDPVPPLPPDDAAGGAPLPPVIAYVTTLTKCAVNNRGSLDGAAVLLHSIRRNSHGWAPPRHLNQTDASPRYGGRGGRYRYRAYVIVDPQASPLNSGRSGDCARALQKLGYVVLHRPPLVPLFEVTDSSAHNHSAQGFFRKFKNQGYVGIHRPKDGPTSLPPAESPDKLRLSMHNDGCCGYTELLKLHVYGLVDHPLAVHLDFDSLLLRPMDDLFDLMLAKAQTPNNNIPLAKGPNTKTPNFSNRIDAAFTRDYNSVKNPSPTAPVGYQGGFLVVRPSLEVLERYRTILQRGEFLLHPRRLGWGGKVGGFYGDVTFQGILPYYYEHVAPQGEHNEMELDRCIYNQMGDNPRKSTYKFPRATPLNATEMGFRDTNVCRDGRKSCSDTDCQRVHPKDSITAHFTFCLKPWDCSPANPGTVVFETCLGLLREWYGVRRELEDWWLLPSPITSGEGSNDQGGDQRSFYWKESTIDKVLSQREGLLNPEQYLGYCDEFGKGGYRSMIPPDGVKNK